MGTLRLLAALLAMLPAWGFGYTKTGNVFFTDGSHADVESAVTAAVDGDIVDVPEGTFFWTDDLTVTGKAITIRGQGGGGFLARSDTAHDIDTGSATWTLDTHPYRFGYPKPDFVIGETITARFAPRGNETFMEGTVTAYEYPSLTINVTSTGAGYATITADDEGGSTQDTNENNWVFSRPAKTTIEATAATASDALMTLVGTASGTVRIEDIKLDSDFDCERVIFFSPNKNEVIAERCWFSLKSGGVVTYWTSLGGVMSRCSLDSGYHVNWASSSSTQGMKMKFGSSDFNHESWTTVHSMGTADTTGLKNTYVETCWFQGIGTSTSDCDDNSRTVFRYNVVNGGDFGGHGPDTGTAGFRHIEFYRNSCLYQDDGAGYRLIDMNGHFGQRGGTGCIWGNYMQDVGNSVWGFQNREIAFRVWVTYGTEGRYGGWGSDDWPGHTGGETVYPATTDAPAPRGPGAGYIDGSRTGPTGEPIGELDPWYIWDNDTSEVRDSSGNLGFSVYIGEARDSAAPTNPDSYTAYLKVDDDDDGLVEGTIMLGTARPDYAPYDYPHPLAEYVVASTYGGRLRFNGTGAKPVRTDGTGQPLIFDQ